MHVSHPDGEAKFWFWLTPALALATSAGLSPKQIKEAEKIVAVHLEEIDHAWRTHFPG